MPRAHPAPRRPRAGQQLLLGCRGRRQFRLPASTVAARALAVMRAGATQFTLPPNGRIVFPPADQPDRRLLGRREHGDHREQPGHRPDRPPVEEAGGAGDAAERAAEVQLAERGRDLESVLHQYLTTVRPMHELFVEPSAVHAELMLDGEGAIEHEVDRLVWEIHGRMKYD